MLITFKINNLIYFKKQINLENKHIILIEIVKTMMKSCFFMISLDFNYF